METMSEIDRGSGYSGQTRRELLVKGGGALFGLSTVGALLGACGGSGGESSGAGSRLSRFILADWGGNTARIRRDTWGRAFTERTGLSVASTALDYGKFRAQVESGNVSWNWLDAEGWFALGNEDLFEEIPYDTLGITERDVLPVPNAFTPKAVMSYHSCYAIGHKTDGDLKPPEDWVEFFDTKAVPGKRSLFNWPYGTVEIALIADGVPYDELYPLDLDRAFRKIDSIRDDVVFYNSGAESQQLLVSGSVDFVQAWHNRIGSAAKLGSPVDLRWGQNLQIVTHHTISKHQKDPDACVEFIRTALSPEPLAEYARASLNAPPTQAAYDLLDEETRRWMSTNPAHLELSVGVIDDRWWGENLDRVSRAWTEWIGA
ncbi:extracellular solute-binding protein [Conexibacter arvalis]|uniref:Putative spermidine/putrescine transport system substrate-binding protein n=1 Tax=Conexibacter arvalis TaxID=912552 RepID=A0A840I957_9ACTN|nr:extracellular solute-binding protein [Conexibacter arvalis]MBB4661396.1 putative spermidine/putrescine transport system substrate-binding protein [Conexibacter arvalis]